MLLPSLKHLKKIGLSIPYLIADMGYIGGEDKLSSITDYSTTTVTQTKKNMIPPDICNDNVNVK